MKPNRWFPVLGLTVAVALGLPAAGRPPKRIIRSSEIEISGEYLRAFLVGYKDLQKVPDLRPEQKQIENYLAICFEKDRLYYRVYFIPKAGPADRFTVGGTTTFGREVKYVIDRKDYAIVKRAFGL